MDKFFRIASKYSVDLRVSKKGVELYIAAYNTISNSILFDEGVYADSDVPVTLTVEEALGILIDEINEKCIL